MPKLQLCYGTLQGKNQLNIVNMVLSYNVNEALSYNETELNIVTSRNECYKDHEPDKTPMYGRRPSTTYHMYCINACTCTHFLK